MIISRNPVNGPFPYGEWPDINIFRSSLIHQLLADERVGADWGYQGNPQEIDLPDEATNGLEIWKKAMVRSRHETVNGRFKKWFILKFPFRHDLVHHGPVFRAIAVLTQIKIEIGYPLFAVGYKTSF